MIRLRQLWKTVRSSLWFVPALIVSGAIALALVLIEADTRISHRMLEDWPRLFGAGADGARGMLAAIAGSMITVVGVTFSITIVAISLASSQYTSRILRNFTSDRANQVVLGVFLGIFTYCLIVLRTIRGGSEGMFVPSLAVLAGVALAIVGVGFLIFFIHHIASSIQASSIIASASEETIKAIDKLFPQELGEEADQEDNQEVSRSVAGAAWHALAAQTTGYIQSIEAKSLLEFACERQTVLRMERGVGEFVVEGTPLASLLTANEPDERASKTLADAYTISRYRTVEQDAAFGIRQIVDIALKALSPGVNDTTTAVTCVDYLSAIMVRLACRRFETPYRFDAGELRVIAKSRTFEMFVNESFDQIRESAEANVAVLLRMLHSIKTVAAFTKVARRRQVLLKQVELIAE